MDERDAKLERISEKTDSRMRDMLNSKDIQRNQIHG
jgi:hypothetical protein